MKIVSVAQMRALEAAAFAAGITEASCSSAPATPSPKRSFARVEPVERVVVLVGHGNNGRDGAVAAEWLLRARRGGRPGAGAAARGHDLTSWRSCGPLGARGRAS